jgi:hypothetical protein
MQFCPLPGVAEVVAEPVRETSCPVSFVLRQSRTREASVSLLQIDETDVPLTCSDSGSASLTCLMISETIDAPGCLTYLRHGRSAPRSCLIFSGTGHLDAALAATADHDLVDPFSTRATMLSTSFDHGDAEGDLTELNGGCSAATPPAPAPPAATTASCPTCDRRRPTRRYRR